MASVPNTRFSSISYWIERYSKGQNSGAGSYGKVAEFKANSLNGFISRYSIHRCIEFGCGDGNQLGLLSIGQYLGLDVAPAAIDICIEKYADDESKSFMLYDPNHFVNNSFLESELTLSMDVILHLIEDEIYDSYMRTLFGTSTKFVAIFNTSTEVQPSNMARHNRFRDHQHWINENAIDFKQISSSLTPVELGYPAGTGFYFYAK